MTLTTNLIGNLKRNLTDSSRDDVGILELPVTTGLVAHYAAFQEGKTEDELVTINLPDAVAAWFDISNNTNNSFESTSSFQPILTSNTINTHPALVFGTDDRLNADSDTSIDDMFDGGGTFFSIATGGVANGRFFDKGGDMIMLLVGIGERHLRVIPGFSTTDGDFRSLDKVYIPAENNIVGMTYNKSSTSNIPVMYLNGSSVAVNVSTTPVGTPDTDAGSNLIIGNNGAGNRAFQGGLGEYIFYDRILTAGEISAVHSYLSEKWGIALA